MSRSFNNASAGLAAVFTVAGALALTGCDAHPAAREGISVAQGFVVLSYPGADGQLKEKRVPYRVEGGDVVIGGDIVVGRATEVRAGDTVALSLVHPAAGDDSSTTTVLAATQTWTKIWPEGHVPYTIDTSISGANRTTLESEIAAINKVFDDAGLSIRLAPRAREQGFIRFVESTDIGGCGNSRLGFLRYGQTINIYPNCFTRRTIHHEIMHALGMIHEHQRPDRDDYIVVGDTDNPNYIKLDELDVKTLGPYDVNSITHYRGLEIKPGVNYDAQARNGVVSPGDIAGLKALYANADNLPYENPVLPTTPTAPSFLQAARQLDGVMTLSWGRALCYYGIRQYQLFREGVPLARVGPTTHSYRDLTAVPGEVYLYQIRARSLFNKYGPLKAAQGTHREIGDTSPFPEGFYQKAGKGSVYYISVDARYCENPPQNLVRNVKPYGTFTGLTFVGACPAEMVVGAPLGPASPTSPGSTIAPGFYHKGTTDNAATVYYVDANKQYCNNPPGHLIRGVTTVQNFDGLTFMGSCPDDLVMGSASGSTIARGFYHKDDGKDTVYFVIDGASYCVHPPGHVMRGVTTVSGLDKLKYLGQCSPTLDYT